ncbi:MAG TPA: DDE-type integrase/transposase/recombinase [Actinomycetota bacterium]|nr:DDE-type integrase/transposase/recombinase [Actinomycetota bacterium]
MAGPGRPAASGHEEDRADGRERWLAVDRTQKGRTTRLGWTVVHVAVDDHSRLAYVEELPDEQPLTTVAFLRRALAFYAGDGIAVHRVMTDNWNPYKSRAFRAELSSLGIRHLRTRPYTRGPTARRRRWSRSC